MTISFINNLSTFTVFAQSPNNSHKIDPRVDSGLIASQTEGVDSSRFMVARIKLGDKLMEGRFYARYYPLVLSLVRFYTQDQPKAEDISQDALIKVLLKLRTTSIDNPESLTSYVCQTAKYTFLGWSRKMENKTYLHESGEAQFYPDADPVLPVMVAEQRAIIASYLKRLAVARDREVLSRFYLHEESKHAICRALDLSHHHFDRIISRARLRFRHLLEHESSDLAARQ